MTETVQIKLDTQVLDKWIEKNGMSVDEAIRDIAFRVEARAKVLAPIDTHALQNSIYTVTQNYDGYAKASAEAKEKNKDVETAPIPTPDKKHTAHVGPCVEYGIYQELGAPSINLPAHPYLRPAVEATAGEIAKQVEQELGKLK